MSTPAETVESAAVRIEAPRAQDFVAEAVSAWFGDHKVLDRVSLRMPAGGSPR